MLPLPLPLWGRLVEKTLARPYLRGLPNTTPHSGAPVAFATWNKLKAT